MASGDILIVPLDAGHNHRLWGGDGNTKNEQRENGHTCDFFASARHYRRR